MAQSVPSSLAAPAHHETESEPERADGFWALALGSLGVVYGDIGTSPIYAFKEALNAAKTGGTVDTGIVLGIVSLTLWALMLIVTFKYVLLLLRAHHHGEGGIFALTALASEAGGRLGATVLMLGIAGAALFYGDCVITPAISVLSAVEGLDLISPAFTKAVLPLSVCILIALFAMQSRGTGQVGNLFGPIMVVWFAALAAGGLLHIADHPAILMALSPTFGISLLVHHGFTGFLILGAVFLAVTGAEALYADLGHFGRPAIQQAWIWVVLPSLALNYLGQGAMVLADPAAAANPFYKLYPGWALVPMIVLATMATVIASQAVITGAYSLTQQAVQLGLLPRLGVRYTSETSRGQIYMPAVNAALMVAVLIVVTGFRSSSALASAYGIAVTGTMLLTTSIAFVLVWRIWHWPVWKAALLLAPLFVVEATFAAANSVKILEGGWLPLLIAVVAFTVMTTWRRGAHLLANQAADVELKWLVNKLETKSPHRVPGTAVFLTADPHWAPTALMHNLKHNNIVHERNIILSIKTSPRPRVASGGRIRVERLSDHFIVVAANFGFMESPNIPRLLGDCRKHGLNIESGGISYFLSRRRLKAAPRSEMSRWQEELFIRLAGLAEDASAYFSIPTDRVIEVGTQSRI